MMPDLLFGRTPIYHPRHPESIGGTTTGNMQESAALKRSKDQVNDKQTLTLIEGSA
jgi:hypothetical protein